MNVGELDREFILQEPTGDAGDYADVETIWGSIRLASGSEVFKFGGPQSTGAYLVEIRYRTDLKASWRIAEKGSSPERSLQIQSYGDPDGQRESLHLFCVELQ